LQLAYFSVVNLPVAEFTALLNRLWTCGGGEVNPVQALDHPALRPDHVVRHAYVDHHLAAGVLPDAGRWTTTHADDRRAGTGGPGADAAGTDLTLNVPRC